MTQAKKGDTVAIHYTGKLSDGTVFDTTEDRDPLEFTLGEGRVIPGFEKAVEGLEEGEEATAEIEPAEGYGPRQDQLVLRMPADRFPEELDPRLGDELEMRTPDGQSVPVRVVGIEEDTVVLDANHPLAGEELTFEIEVVGIDRPSGA